MYIVEANNKMCGFNKVPTREEIIKAFNERSMDLSEEFTKGMYKELIDVGNTLTFEGTKIRIEDVKIQTMEFRFKKYKGSKWNTLQYIQIIQTLIKI